MTAKLAIVAGGGSLPRRLIAAAQAGGRDVLVIGFPGHTDPETLEAASSMTLPLGSVKPALERLRREGITDICMAGRLRRPSLSELRPDWWAAKILAKVGVKALGDDGLLRAVVQALEGEGLRVVGPDEIMQSLLTPAGSLGRHRPDEQGERDIARGVEVARALGAVDVGQAVVVQQGLVLGVEAIEGTDALLRRCGRLRRGGGGGVLVKMRKPGQERRVDLPAAGPETVAAAAAAGLAGIALEAGGTLLLDRAATVEAADAAGLFLVGVAPAG